MSGKENGPRAADGAGKGIGRDRVARQRPFAKDGPGSVSAGATGGRPATGGPGLIEWNDER